MLHLRFLLWAAVWCWWFLNKCDVDCLALTVSVQRGGARWGHRCCGYRGEHFCSDVLVLVDTRVATSGGAVVARLLDSRWCIFVRKPSTRSQPSRNVVLCVMVSASDISSHTFK